MNSPRGEIEVSRERETRLVADDTALVFPGWATAMAGLDWPEDIKKRRQLAVMRLLKFCKLERRPVSVTLIKGYLEGLEQQGYLWPETREGLRWFVIEARKRMTMPAEAGGVIRVSGAGGPVGAPPREETRRLLGALEGTSRLMASLGYGAGLRLMELLRLRVKDVDLERGQLTVRSGKGDKDRVTLLPERLREPLHEHLERLRVLWREDRAAGVPGVWLPEALARKLGKAGES